MNITSPEPTVSAAAVRSNMHPVKSEALVPDNIDEQSTHAPEPIEVSHNAVSKRTDEAEPMETASAASLLSALDDNDGKTVSSRQLCRKKLRDRRYCLQS